ncbi:hypothetical protein B0H19DRAFT_1120102 [Mycena capillaripes]|nr:hypothetical protein B0H19DRAFT_1120102 [Mycena capillaripes]
MNFGRKDEPPSFNSTHSCILPPEITSEFFLRCLPPEKEWNTAKADEPSIVLSHVCRAWREIAISTPALWATIEFPVSYMRNPELFETWLMRAGRSVSAKISPWTALSPAVLNTFIERSPKIKVLELLDTDLVTLRQMDEAYSAWNFFSLQKLTIKLASANELGVSLPFSVEAFTGAPLLREVWFAIAPPSLISLPGHQLTKFTGAHYTADECLTMLRLTPNLIECAFSPYPGTENIDANYMLIHSNLTSLTLFEVAPEHVCGTDIIEFLTLPALQSLHILDCEFDDDAFNAFLSRSSPPLHEFSIRQDSGTALDMTSFLLMPELVDLEIWQIRRTFSTIFFDALGSDPNFLPRLQHLAVLGCRMRSPEPPVYTLLETVESGLRPRWDARGGEKIAELESFRLTWARDFGHLHGDVLAPFEELAAEGLDIHMESKTKVYCSNEYFPDSSASSSESSASSWLET